MFRTVVSLRWGDGIQDHQPKNRHPSESWGPWSLTVRDWQVGIRFKADVPDSRKLSPGWRLSRRLITSNSLIISKTKVNPDWNDRLYPYRASIFRYFNPGLPPDEAEFQRDLLGDFFDVIQFYWKADTKKSGSFYPHAERSAVWINIFTVFVVATQ